VTEQEWLVCDDPGQMFTWLRRIGGADRHRLGLFFVACCNLIPLSIDEGESQGPEAAPCAGYGQVALENAELHLSGAVSEAMRAVGGGECERATLVALIRDIFGDPFRPPVEFSAEWRTSTAVALARQMYESRDFSAMPILADALQDAGCDNADILDHCRGPGPHVRGCWVVDLVLGKT
jgi:hypothetical protein